MSLTEEGIKLFLLTWGAGLSTLLAGIKLWESLWRDRPRVRTKYSLTEEPGEPDTIMLINISPNPIHVSAWKLEWKPKKFRRNAHTIDVTPGDHGGNFKIDGQSNFSLPFAEGDKFDWSGRTSKDRRLMMTLHVFGRWRPIVLKVMDGT